MPAIKKPPDTQTIKLLKQELQTEKARLQKTQEQLDARKQSVEQLGEAIRVLSGNGEQVQAA